MRTFSHFLWLSLVLLPLFSVAQDLDSTQVQTLDSIPVSVIDSVQVPIPHSIPWSPPDSVVPDVDAYAADILLLVPDHNAWSNLLVNLYQNPAMTGYGERHNFLLQWESPFYASQKFGGQAMFAYDFSVPMLKEKHPGKFNWGTGMYYRASNYGDRYRRTKFGITHSFSVNLKNGGKVRAGLEFFNFYIHPLTEEQLDGNIAPNQGTGTRVGEGRLDGGVLGYGMISLGLWYQMPRYFVGVSANNINTLEGWHFGGNETARAMPMELYVQGGYHFPMGRVVLTPMLEYYSKNITVQSFRPRINIQSLGGKLLTGIGYGTKTVTANVGYRTKFISLNVEGGVSTHTFGPLKGGWVAGANVLIHFKGKKNQPTPTNTNVILTQP